MKVITAWRVVGRSVDVRLDEDILYSAARFWAWLATLGGPVAAAWWPKTPDYHAAYRYDLLGSVVGVRVRRRP